MDLEIRKYRDSDQNRVMDIWYEASKVGHPFLSEEALQKDRQEIIEKYIPIANQWVCQVDGSVVGFIALIDDFIGGLFVDPKWHGKGIGTKLIDKAKSLHDELAVEVFRQNKKAIGFYEKCGLYLIEEKTCEHTGLPAMVYGFQKK